MEFCFFLISVGNLPVDKELTDNLYFISAPSRFLDRPRRAWDDSDIIGYRTMSTLANFPGKSQVTTCVLCSSHLFMFFDGLYCNNMDPDQTAQGSSMIWVHFVCIHEKI